MKKPQKLIRRHFFISQDHAAKITKSAKVADVTESQIVRTILSGLFGEKAKKIK